MRKVWILAISILIFGLSSCEDNSTAVESGISGLGQNKGNIEVKEKFELPDGIFITEDITGIASPESGKANLKGTELFYLPCYGSGSQVQLQLTLLNTRSYPMAVFFPKGLVWECKTGGFQHGLQVQCVWVCLQPNETRTIRIDLYCANLTYPTPDQTGIYSILGVTSSDILWKFLNWIGWRMVNYEMLVGNDDLKSSQVGPSYEEIVNRFQVIVHNLTDRGLGLSDDDIAFIESIPELPEDKRPEVDENGNYPDYFEEFVVSYE